MRIFLIAPLLLVAACGATSTLTGPATGAAPAETGGPPAVAGEDTCGAAPFVSLIGQPVGDAAAFRDAGLTFRVIYPGDAVTADFSPTRLNIIADTFGTITAMECY